MGTEETQGFRAQHIARSFFHERSLAINYNLEGKQYILLLAFRLIPIHTQS